MAKAATAGDAVSRFHLQVDDGAGPRRLSAFSHPVMPTPRPIAPPADAAPDRTEADAEFRVTRAEPPYTTERLVGLVRAIDEAVRSCRTGACGPAASTQP